MDRRFELELLQEIPYLVRDGDRAEVWPGWSLLLSAALDSDGDQILKAYSLSFPGRIFSSAATSERDISSGSRRSSKTLASSWLLSRNMDELGSPAGEL